MLRLCDTSGLQRPSELNRTIFRKTRRVVTQKAKVLLMQTFNG